MIDILLLCDDPDVQSQLSRDLEAASIDAAVDAATSVPAALKMISNKGYDAVVTFRATSHVESVALILAACRSAPGHTILTTSGGAAGGHIEFQMIVRIDDAMIGLARPMPTGRIVEILRAVAPRPTRAKAPA